MSFYSIKPEVKVRTRNQRLKEELSMKEDPLATNAHPFVIDKSNSKCGEIFVSKATNFILICSTCKNEFGTMESFGIHWQEENNCVHDNFEEIKQTPKVEIEDEAICLPAIFVEVKSEIIGDPQLEVQPVDTIDDSNGDVNLKPSIKSENQDDSLQRKDLGSTVKRRSVGRPKLNVTESDLYCRICERQFQDLKSCRKHSHKIPNDLKCKYCDKVFTNSSKYFEHIKTHKGKRKFQCPHCPNKLFRSHQDRQEHLAVHTGERPYKCSSCPKAYATKYALDEHTRRHQYRAFACEICDKRYLEMNTLAAHRRMHTGERPYQCEECGKSFASSTILSKHRKRHSEKNFKCEICEMAFFMKAELTEHNVKHTGARPFKCEICGNTFPRKRALRYHMDLHSTEKKYVCDICGKSYQQHIGLYMHRKTH